MRHCHDKPIDYATAHNKASDALWPTPVLGKKRGKKASKKERNGPFRAPLFACGCVSVWISLIKIRSFFHRQLGGGGVLRISKGFYRQKQECTKSCGHSKHTYAKWPCRDLITLGVRD